MAVQNGLPRDGMVAFGELCERGGVAIVRAGESFGSLDAWVLLEFDQRGDLPLRSKVTMRRNDRCVSSRLRSL